MKAIAHRKIIETFPGLIAEGWRYRGCYIENLGPVPFFFLRFHKQILDRVAYAEMQIAVEKVNDPFFGFRDWVCRELQTHELRMIDRRRRELDTAA